MADADLTSLVEECRELRRRAVLKAAGVPGSVVTTMLFRSLWAFPDLSGSLVAYCAESPFSTR